MQWVSGWVVALSVAFVVVAGCSSNNSESSHSRLNGEVQATPTSGSPPRASSSPGTMTSNVPSSGGVQAASTSGPMRTGSSEGVFIPADFVGMWDYYEGVDVLHAALRGVLLVEGPCVYIIDDREGYPERPLEDMPEPTVYFIELPRNRTWYDPDTQSIWSWDHGPMTNGDRVVVGGGGGYANPPDVCSDADSVWFGSGMSPAPCVAWLSPERYTGCRPEDLLAGLWNYNPARPSYAPAAEGVLLIKGPCVYVIDDFAWLVPSVPWDEFAGAGSRLREFAAGPDPLRLRHRDDLGRRRRPHGQRRPSGNGRRRRPKPSRRLLRGRHPRVHCNPHVPEAVRTVGAVRTPNRMQARRSAVNQGLAPGSGFFGPIRRPEGTRARRSDKPDRGPVGLWKSAEGHRPPPSPPLPSGPWPTNPAC